MFEGIDVRVVTDAEKWLYAHGYHHQGDFRVQLANGGHVDLREVVADFSETYHAGLIGRVKAWQKIAEDAVVVKPVPPIVVPASLPRTSCNRHSDCRAADEAAKAKGATFGASHCHDECCEDCFGC
jgi:hypothetical protein